MISNFGGQISPVGQSCSVNGSTATSFQKFPPLQISKLGFAMEHWMNKENGNAFIQLV
ncbi:MAG: hypothetical protein R2942_13420 [Ignavibacteria bacterium]